MIAAESKLEASRNKSHCKEYSTIFDAFYRIQLDDRCIGILTNECFIVSACTAFATLGVYFDRIGFFLRGLMRIVLGISMFLALKRPASTYL